MTPQKLAKFDSRLQHLQAANDAGAFGNGGEPPYDGGMETRIAKLEDTMTDVRERLVRIETQLGHTATKEELHRMESTLIKWFLGTAIALASLAFAAAKFVH